ncbi:MAG: 30S ribosomal protein THX [Chloroflexota bacterium]|jgi:ribosomal small subunit protein bTHX|nr:30S ribosomal protein THX [Lentimicrobium sp.]
MGKGDKKTKRGKIILGSHGVTRPRKTNPVAVKKEVIKTVDDAAKTKSKPKTTKKVKEE